MHKTIQSIFKAAKLDFPHELGTTINDNSSPEESIIEVQKWTMGNAHTSFTKCTTLLINLKNYAHENGYSIEATLCDFCLTQLYYMQGKFDNSIQIGKQFVNVASSLKHFSDYNKIVIGYSTIGASLNARGQYEDSLKYLLMAHELVQSQSIIPTALGILYNDLGGTYLDLNDMNKAEKYFHLGLSKIKSQTSIDTTRSQIPFLVNLGELYQKNKNYKDSEKFLLEAKQYCENHDVVYNIPHVLYRLGELYLNINKLDLAFEFLKESISLAKKYDNNVVVMDALYNLSKLYSKTLDFELAETTIEKALKLGIDAKSDSYLSKCYLELSTILKTKNKFTESIDALEKHQFHSKIIFNQQIDSLNNQNQYKLDQLYVTMETVKKDEENKRLQQEVEHKNRELTSKVLFSASNRNFIEDIKTRLESNESLNNLIKLCEEKLSETQDWAEFENRFNDVHPNFIKQLKQISSSLSPMEIRVCTLIKMGYDTNEIAGLLWISKRGVDQHRYRIKKKLNLRENVSKFIISI
ncbi:MAG: hypothetical protein H8E72_07080 [Candidatus Marinimicrobia bacterium]|nr:hypothetical protein [Candidatus Neomarinimicrobiota bacterium]